MQSFFIFLPFITAFIVGLNTRVLSVKAAQVVTVSGMVITALWAWITFFSVVGADGAVQIIPLIDWIKSGDLSIQWVIRIDQLTAVMLILVTTVSALVHIYSIGYMSHDPHPQRFMSYLSLFTFFMLMLVTSDNFVQLFLGWEGVGLCSYLLIGFWYKKESANKAAMKAFIVNRVGDFGFALGICAIFLVFDSVQFSEVFAAAASYKDHTSEFLGMEFHSITLICVLLFIGAMGKSAQLGLHTWLPDAMEGPTPVSALIHAATMVTAGVFMVARCSPLFEYSPTALELVTYVGAFTCLFAATIAITQNDIKRVIAYSTCSQLGYMFFACGVSAYSAGVFHLLTHGFFKALLFLGAGSVIHAMSNEQDMRKMGGIWKHIKLTYVMMIIGTLAITGVPFLSGYWSKDLILESAWAAGHNGHGAGQLAFILGIAAATLTAFYSWRLIFLTFHGKPRASEEVMSHIHESPKVMTVPLMILAVGAIFAGGYFSVVLHIGSAEISEFWGSSLFMLTTSEYNVLEAAHHVPAHIKYAPLMVGIIGLFVAWLLYIKAPTLPAKIAATFAPLYKFLLNKWYFDELYDLLFVRPTKLLGKVLWQLGDVRIIDRFGPNGAATLARSGGRVVSYMQSGYVYHYAFVMLIGVLGILSWFFYDCFFSSACI